LNVNIGLFNRITIDGSAYISDTKIWSFANTSSTTQLAASNQMVTWLLRVLK
jgi:hypothetical protein